MNPRHASVFVVLFATACSSSGGTTGSGGATASSVTGVTSAATTGAQTTGAGTTSSGTGGSPPAMELLHEEGRFDLTTPDKPTFTWSGTSIGARFTGGCQSIEVALDGASKVWFQVEIDGQPTDKFVTTGGAANYPVAQNLSAASTHDVRIIRRNEGYFGNVSFVSFNPTGCQAVPSPVPHIHKIEYVGDSITCGYGIEGTNPCSFSGDTESEYTTYASIAARNLDAAAHFIAYSGKGIHQNYGGNTMELMPELYLRTLTNDANSMYDFTIYEPDLVLVNLGTNDFSVTIDGPAFVSDYEAFLGAIRQRRPNATIICVTWKHWGAAHEALVTQAVTGFGDPKVLTTEFEIKAAEGLGCNGHPNLVTHARLGMELTAFIQAHLGW